MDQRAQEDVFPLQLLLEASESPAENASLTNCVVAAAPTLNVPFNYTQFVHTMLRYARAHETSPGQYPTFDIRCFGFCLMHPSSVALVRLFVDLCVGRSPMVMSGPASASGSGGGSKRRAGRSNADAADADTAGDHDAAADVDGAAAQDQNGGPVKFGNAAPIVIPDEDEDDEDLDEEERTARRERRTLRLNKASAIELNALRQLEHNLGMVFERRLRFVQEVKVRKAAGPSGEGSDDPSASGRAPGDDAADACVDWELEGFPMAGRGSSNAAASKRVAPKATRAAELKVLVSSGKLPKLRRGAAPPPIASRVKPTAADDSLLYEIKPAEFRTVSESDMVAQIQADHVALRNLVRLALKRIGIQLSTGVLLRALLTKFITATHTAPTMSLFEVCIRSELPPELTAAERVALRKQQDAEEEELRRARRSQHQHQQRPSEPDAASPSPDAAPMKGVEISTQTGPEPTKVRVVYVDKKRHDPAQAEVAFGTSTGAHAPHRRSNSTSARRAAPTSRTSAPSQEDQGAKQPAPEPEPTTDAADPNETTTATADSDDEQPTASPDQENTGTSKDHASADPQPEHEEEAAAAKEPAEPSAAAEEEEEEPTRDDAAPAPASGRDGAASGSRPMSPLSSSADDNDDMAPNSNVVSTSQAAEASAPAQEETADASAPEKDDEAPQSLEEMEHADEPEAGAKPKLEQKEEETKAVPPPEAEEEETPESADERAANQETSPTRRSSDGSPQLQERPASGPTPKDDAWFEEQQDADAAASNQPAERHNHDAPQHATPKPEPGKPHERRPLTSEDTRPLNEADARPSHRPAAQTGQQQHHATEEKRSPAYDKAPSQEAPRPQQTRKHAAPAPVPVLKQRRPKPVPVAAGTEDVAPALQPLLVELAGKYQMAHGKTVPPARPTQAAPGGATAQQQGGGAPYAQDVEVALGLRKPKAARDREAARRRMQQEEAFLRENQAGRRLLPPVTRQQPGAGVPDTHAGVAHKSLSAPVQRHPRNNQAATLSPALKPKRASPGAGGMAVGGVPFEHLPPSEQRRVIVALAQAVEQQQHDLGEGGAGASSPSPASAQPTKADERRHEAVVKRRDERRDFDDFMKEQQNRSVFEEQQRQRRQREQQQGI